MQPFFQNQQQVATDNHETQTSDLHYIVRGHTWHKKKITTVILGGRKAGTHQNPPNISFLTVKINTSWDWGGVTVLSRRMEGWMFVSQEP